MKPKQIAILAVFIIFGLPLLFGVLKLSINSAQDPGNVENIEDSAELLTEAAIPWWLGIFEWFSGLPGIIGVVLIIGFIYFLKWIGEIK